MRKPNNAPYIPFTLSSGRNVSRLRFNGHKYDSKNGRAFLYVRTGENQVQAVEVSPEALPTLSRYSWQINNSGYVVTSVADRKGKKVTMTIHEFILGKREGLEIHHIDGNKMNNRFDNLEHVTKSENLTFRSLEWIRQGRPICVGNQNEGRYTVMVRGTYYGTYATHAEAIAKRNEVFDQFINEYEASRSDRPQLRPDYWENRVEELRRSGKLLTPSLLRQAIV